MPEGIQGIGSNRDWRSGKKRFAFPASYIFRYPSSHIHDTISPESLPYIITQINLHIKRRKSVCFSSVEINFVLVMLINAWRTGARGVQP